MFDIDACYKVIFEALSEQQGLENIVKKVCEYTKARIYLISISGEIFACACEEAEEKTASIMERHLTLKEYDLKRLSIRKSDQPIYEKEWNRYYYIAEFGTDGKKIGYSVFVFEDGTQCLNMKKVNEVLCQALEIQFKESEYKGDENISMRHHICAWTLFSKKIRKEDWKILKQEIKGQYFLTLVPRKDKEQNTSKIVHQIQKIWDRSFFYFGEKNLCIFFYGVCEESREQIIAEVKKIGYCMCVSELFTDLAACAQKKEFLERMSQLDGYWKTAGVMDEKEWYVETVFSYAVAMFSEIGLNDYTIEQLCKEDAEKNLELYETLKMYFLCENNINVTAAKLHVHKNTLVYRLKQIQNCIGVNINDSKISKELLSFMLMFDIVRKNGD